jgi:Na+-transporting NADH:ubiquinone oxidoreductase subunit F
MLEILLGVVFFTTIIVVLTLLVLFARRLLVPSGTCSVRVNASNTLTASVGQRLLEVLNQADINLPSACGGAGTCGLCKARVTSGGGESKPQENALLTRREVAKGIRLACQVPILGAMDVEVEEAYFGVKTWRCKVQSVRHVATLISEIVLKLPGNEKCVFRPGSFVQVTCPPYQLDYSSLDIADKYRDIWNKSELWALKVSTGESVTRAYSVANKPEFDDVVSLNIRIAVPPPHNRQIPAGVVSSWLFSLKPGAEVDVTGPYGLFFVEPSDKEAIFIGGGVGMAPLYAQILDLLKTWQSTRKISYWYGARSKRELYYDEEFEQLQSEHDNFSWHVALSAPEKQDQWNGLKGFIHNVIADEYLTRHSAPENCEYYLCGPPLMIKAILSLLDDLGVESEAIHYDDFGGG